jgi:RNA polymerase sigma-B factor
MDLELTMVPIAGGALLRGTGVIDAMSMPYLRRTLFTRLDRGDRELVIDLSAVRLLDAATIGGLLHVARRADAVGGSLRVVGARGVVLEALEIIGAAKALGVYDESPLPEVVGPLTDVDLSTVGVGRGGWPPEATALVHRLQELTGPAHQRLRDQVIERCLPAAHALSRRYTEHPDFEADVNQVAAMGLIKAVDGFDPTFGVDFPAFARPTIIGELKRYFRDATWTVRVSRRLQELRVTVNRANDQLAQQLGRSPTVADIADAAGIEPSEVVEAIGANNVYHPSSLDVPIGDGGTATMGDTLGAEDPAFDLVEYGHALHHLLNELPERERRILIMRFSGNLTQLEIAQRIGLSQMHVSRLLHASLRRLRARLTEE